jgi:SAM-dependent methyltransferase
MLQSPGSFFSSAPVQALFARELDALAPILSGVYGNFGLFLRAHLDAPSALPAHLLGRVLQLVLDSGRFAGDLNCEPSLLPFASESFKLVIAQHVLEQLEPADACAAELARVLAPEGVALVLGFNPAGSWRPWLALNAKRGGARLHLQSAHVWQQRLAREQVDTLQIRFPGTFRQHLEKQTGDSPLARFGSTWLLLARKRRNVLTPLRLRGSAREMALKPRLAPGTQRACA